MHVSVVTNKRPPFFVTSQILTLNYVSQNNDYFEETVDIPSYYLIRSQFFNQMTKQENFYCINMTIN